MPFVKWFVLFVSYGLCAVASSHLLLYLKYWTLGYTWSAVIKFIVTTPEFYVATTTFIICTIIVCSATLASPYKS